MEHFREAARRRMRNRLKSSPAPYPNQGNWDGQKNNGAKLFFGAKKSAFGLNRDRSPKMPFLGVLRFCASNDIRKGGKMSKWGDFVVRFFGGGMGNFRRGVGDVEKS